MRKVSALVFLLTFAAMAGERAGDIAALTRGLASRDKDVQRNAAANLMLLAQFGQIGSGDLAKVVDAEIAALANAPPDTRAFAAITLGLLRDKRATPALLAATRDSDQTVRSKAISSLGHLRDPRAVAPLEKLQQNGTEIDRRYAAAALREIETGERPAPPKEVTQEQLQRVLQNAVEVKPAWQSSWPAFVTAFAGESGVPHGEPDLALQQRFGGQVVTWEGIVNETGTANLRRGRVWILSLRMTPASIRMKGTDQTYPIEVVLRPRDSELAKWKTLNRGTTVRFRATLHSIVGGAFYAIMDPTIGVEVMAEDATVLE